MLVWWPERNDCGGNTASYWCQATTAMRMVAATRPFMLHNDAGLHWVELFSSSFGLRLCGDGKSSNVACVSTTMIHNACVLH